MSGSVRGWPIEIVAFLNKTGDKVQSPFCHHSEIKRLFSQYTVPELHDQPTVLSVGTQKHPRTESAPNRRHTGYNTSDLPPLLCEASRKLIPGSPCRASS